MSSAGFAGSRRKEEFVSGLSTGEVHSDIVMARQQEQFEVAILTNWSLDESSVSTSIWE
jgi:hypothetical protein